MSPKTNYVSPIAKTGAELVNNERCTRIELVTYNQTTVIMDPERASEVQRFEERRKEKLMLSAPLPIRELVHQARAGDLSGTTGIVGDELHFRPDGFRFWVPVDFEKSEAWYELNPGAHYEILGEIELRRGRPDSIIIHQARQIN